MKFQYIQVIRAAAAIAVVLFHSFGTGASHNFTHKVDHLSRFQLGEIGVDIFFVISGFIIYSSYVFRDQSPAEFLRRRVERILPLYWVITLVVLSSTFAGFTKWSPEITNIILSLLFASFIEGKFPVVYVGWTLEYEFIFYFSVFLALILVPRQPWRTVVIAFSTLVLAGRVSGFEETQVLRFMTNSIIIEFCLGILIGQVIVSRSVDWIVAAAIIFVYFIVASEEPTNRILYAGLPAAILVLLAAAVQPHLVGAQGRAMSMLMLLGDASYAIYLAQVLTISATAKIVKAMLPSMSLDLFAVVATLITVASGLLCHKLIETPLLRIVRMRKSCPESARAETTA